jgi:hypothetical protein
MFRSVVVSNNPKRVGAPTRILVKGPNEMLSVYLGSDVLAGLDPISTFFVCAQKNLGAFDSEKFLGMADRGRSPDAIVSPRFPKHKSGTRERPLSH